GDDVFLDNRSLAPTDRFLAKILRKISKAHVVLAIIGPSWMKGLSRPEDVVRRELTYALRRKKPIVPIVLPGSRMPSSKRLPRGLRRLSEWQALHLRPEVPLDEQLLP